MYLFIALKKGGPQKHYYITPVMEETGLCLLSRDACKVNYIIVYKVMQMTSHLI
jgi:hypothetical protein